MCLESKTVPFRGGSFSRSRRGNRFRVRDSPTRIVIGPSEMGVHEKGKDELVIDNTVQNWLNFSRNQVVHEKIPLFAKNDESKLGSFGLFDIRLRDKGDTRNMGKPLATARCLVDSTGEILCWNLLAESIFGRSASSVVKQTIFQVLGIVDGQNSPVIELDKLDGAVWIYPCEQKEPILMIVHSQFLDNCHFILDGKRHASVYAFSFELAPSDGKDSKNSSPHKVLFLLEQQEKIEKFSGGVCEKIAVEERLGGNGDQMTELLYSLPRLFDSFFDFCCEVENNGLILLSTINMHELFPGLSSNGPSHLTNACGSANHASILQDFMSSFLRDWSTRSITLTFCVVGSQVMPIQIQGFCRRRNPNMPGRIILFLGFHILSQSFDLGGMVEITSLPNVESNEKFKLNNALKDQALTAKSDDEKELPKVDAWMSLAEENCEDGMSGSGLEGDKVDESDAVLSVSNADRMTNYSAWENQPMSPSCLFPPSPPNSQYTCQQHFPQNHNDYSPPEYLPQSSDSPNQYPSSQISPQYYSQCAPQYALQCAPQFVTPHFPVFSSQQQCISTSETYSVHLYPPQLSGTNPEFPSPLSNDSVVNASILTEGEISPTASLVSSCQNREDVFTGKSQTVCEMEGSSENTQLLPFDPLYRHKEHSSLSVSQRNNDDSASNYCEASRLNHVKRYSDGKISSGSEGNFSFLGLALSRKSVDRVSGIVGDVQYSVRNTFLCFTDTDSDVPHGFVSSHSDPGNYDHVDLQVDADEAHHKADFLINDEEGLKEEVICLTNGGGDGGHGMMGLSRGERVDTFQTDPSWGGNPHMLSQSEGVCFGENSRIEGNNANYRQSPWNCWNESHVSETPKKNSGRMCRKVNEKNTMPEDCQKNYSLGSVGHPHCCSRPCRNFKMKMHCKDGANCYFCHMEHGLPPRLDKRHRNALDKLHPWHHVLLFAPLLLTKASVMPVLEEKMMELLEKIGDVARRMWHHNPPGFGVLSDQEQHVSDDFCRNGCVRNGFSGGMDSALPTECVTEKGVNPPMWYLSPCKNSCLDIAISTRLERPKAVPFGVPSVDKHVIGVLSTHSVGHLIFLWKRIMIKNSVELSQKNGGFDNYAEGSDDEMKSSCEKAPGKSGGRGGGSKSWDQCGHLMQLGSSCDDTFKELWKKYKAMLLEIAGLRTSLIDLQEDNVKLMKGPDFKI